MIAIIAVNNLGFIGKDGELPWKCSSDLKLFKNMTQGETLLVGYNTSLKLPKLEGRKVVVDDRDINKEKLSEEKELVCIGGKKTYERYCHLFTELHISHINDNTIGDTPFPDLGNLNPNCKVYNYHF